jgi:hypothetical protein
VPCTWQIFMMGTSRWHTTYLVCAHLDQKLASVTSYFFNTYLPYYLALGDCTRRRQQYTLPSWLNRQRGQSSRKRVHGALAVNTMILRRCRTAAMTVSWSANGLSCKAVRSWEHAPSGAMRVQCLRACTLYERVCDVAAGSYDDLALAHIYVCCVFLVVGVLQLLLRCNLLDLI